MWFNYNLCCFCPAVRYGHCLLEGLECVDLSQCPPLERAVHHSPTLPLVLTRLKDYLCGLKHGTAQVCCPTNAVIRPTPKPRRKETRPDVFIVSHRNFNLINRDCGLGLTDRILGGQNALPGEFPWLAALQYNGKCRYVLAYLQVGIYS
jgi:hypothetical protein